jgi:hypothetical protein
MQIRFGDFGLLDSAGYRQVLAIVSIPESDFRRFELGEYEHPTAVSPCFAWCVKTFGPGGERWLVRFAEGGLRIEFRDAADAMAFHDAWAGVVVSLAA